MIFDDGVFSQFFYKKDGSVYFLCLKEAYLGNYENETLDVLLFQKESTIRNLSVVFLSKSYGTISDSCFFCTHAISPFVDEMGENLPKSYQQQLHV